MKIFKKWLPLLLAAVLLTGAFAAFSACAPIEPNIPPEEEEPGGGHPLIVEIDVAVSPLLFEDVVYELSPWVEGIKRTDDLIGLYVDRVSIWQYWGEYQDIGLATWLSDPIFERYYDNEFFIYSVEGYPVEQCIMLYSEWKEEEYLYTSDQFVLEEEA